MFQVEEYLNELPIKALPGIGHVLEDKLKRREVKTCKQLRLISKVFPWASLVQSYLVFPPNILFVITELLLIFYNTYEVS